MSQITECQLETVNTIKNFCEVYASKLIFEYAL